MVNGPRMNAQETVAQIIQKTRLTDVLTDVEFADLVDEIVQDTTTGASRSPWPADDDACPGLRAPRRGIGSIGVASSHE